MKKAPHKRGFSQFKLPFYVFRFFPEWRIALLFPFLNHNGFEGLPRTEDLRQRMFQGEARCQSIWRAFHVRFH